MPLGAEDDDSLPGDALDRDLRHQHQHQHHQHDHDTILIEPEEDRWRWRRRIRQNPRQLVCYRAAVGVAGLFFIVLGLVSGPLPGPGGIPLVLLGLAIWSSEFEWAQRVMEWFKLQLHRFRQWNRPEQTLFWVAFFTACGLFGYLYLLAIGPPGWIPELAANALMRLPGLH